ncbi:MAG: hypothetical protein WCA83_00040 [Azonexus sp.]
MADEDEDQYICVGICMVDPDSGYCLGCGRPPLDSPEVVCEVVTPVAAPDTSSNDPDNPE